MNSGTIYTGCSCKKPIKEYSKSGCNACWTCKICNKFGGCDNSATLLKSKYNAWTPELLVVEAKPEPKCEHCFHLVENGEVMTSHPCWYQVMCCKCGHGDHMRTDTWACRYRVKSKATGKDVSLGPKLVGQLYRGK